MSLRQQVKEIGFFTRFELLKMIRQGRLATGLAILLGFTFLCALGAEARLYELEKRHKHQLENRSIEEVINTVTFSLHCLPPAMDILFPILVGIFSAAIFAGEFEGGLIRTQAIRPISRTHLFLGKFLAMSLYITVFLGLLWVLSLLTGAALFERTGDVYVWGHPFRLGFRGYILGQSLAWKRYCWMYLASFPIIWCYVCIFMVFSVIFKRFTTAAAVPIGIYFVSISLEGMPVFQPIKTYLPSFYFQCWKYFAAEKILWSSMTQGALIMLAMAVLCLFGGIYLFKSTEI